MADKRKIDKVLGEGEMTPPDDGTKKVKAEPEDTDDGSFLSTNATQKIDKVLGEGEMTPPDYRTKKVKTEPEDTDNDSSLAINAMPSENGQVRRFEPEVKQEVQQTQGMGLLEGYGNAQQPTANWLELAPLAGNMNFNGLAPDYLQALFPDIGLMNQMTAFLAGNVAHGIAAPGIVAPGFLAPQGMPDEEDYELSDSDDGVEVVDVLINRDAITINTFGFPYPDAKIQDAIYTRRKFEEIDINDLIQEVEKKTTDTTHFIYLMTDLESELSLSVYPYTNTILGLEKTSHNLILETYVLSSKLLKNLAQIMENIHFSSFQTFNVNVNDFFILVKSTSNVVHSITRMNNCVGPSNGRSVAIRTLQFFPNYNGDPYNAWHINTRVYNEKLFRDGKQTIDAFQRPILEFPSNAGDSVLQFIAENYTCVHHNISMKNCFIRAKTFKQYLLARMECLRDTTAEFGMIYFENAKELEWINSGPITFNQEKAIRFTKATMISFEYVDNNFKLQGTAFAMRIPLPKGPKALTVGTQVDVAHKEVGKDSCEATSSTQRPVGGNIAPQPPIEGNLAPQPRGRGDLAPQPPVGENIAPEASDLEDPTPQPRGRGDLAPQPPVGGNLAPQDPLERA